MTFVTLNLDLWPGKVNQSLQKAFSIFTENGVEIQAPVLEVSCSQAFSYLLIFATLNFDLWPWKNNQFFPMTFGIFFCKCHLNSRTYSWITVLTIFVRQTDKQTDKQIDKHHFPFLKGTFRVRGSQNQLCRFLILKLSTMIPAYFHLRSINKMLPMRNSRGGIGMENTLK